MNEKQITIIESGMDLIAHQGYHQTSIQQIAESAGISKGAFYLYFESKESFIATAFKYFHQKIIQRLENIQAKELQPTHSLARQINVITRSIVQYKSFIMMHISENIGIGERMEQLVQEIKWYNFRWLRDHILAIHGEKVNEYLLDCIIQFEGIMNSYFKAIVIDGVQLDLHHIGPFLVERLDDIVYGMVHKQEKPLMSLAYRKTFEWHIQYKSNEQQLTDVLYEIRGKIKTLPFDREKKDELQDVVDTILRKVKEESGQKVVIQGLLVHLQRIPELNALCQQFAQMAHVHLIDLPMKEN